MAFFQSAVGVLQTLVIALGAGLGICVAEYEDYEISFPCTNGKD